MASAKKPIPDLTGMEYQVMAGQYVGSIRRLMGRKSKFEPQIYLVKELAAPKGLEMSETSEAMAWNMLKKPGPDIKVLRLPDSYQKS